MLAMLCQHINKRKEMCKKQNPPCFLLCFIINSDWFKFHASKSHYKHFLLALCVKFRSRQVCLQDFWSRSDNSSSMLCARLRFCQDIVNPMSSSTYTLKKLANLQSTCSSNLVNLPNLKSI
ncbi:hypothetical protein ACOSQ3_032254 [Xanthoceras sorbifolium]